ncbi:MAG: hypothetical protein HQK99_00785 [Nitrospirae bacterium]|nr:hypothetical protein [Nitrospirota bacterium]
MTQLYKRFTNETADLRNLAVQIIDAPKHHRDWRFKYASVSLISELWQVWCKFCREIIILSCSGTLNRDGSLVAGRSGDNTWQRIAYEFKEYAPGKPLKSTGRINSMWKQPTWGDINKFLSVIPSLGISNEVTLTNAFGCNLQAPKHLQIVRNACLHLNAETFKNVTDLLPFYIGFAINHPFELIWRSYPTSRSDAIFEWIDGLEIIADFATSPTT